jgi:hypothetical protein
MPAPFDSDLRIRLATFADWRDYLWQVFIAFVNWHSPLRRQTLPLQKFQDIVLRDAGPFRRSHSNLVLSFRLSTGRHLRTVQCFINLHPSSD